MPDRPAVGFDRKIELSWLDVVADATVQGVDQPAVRSRLQHLLQMLSDRGDRGARSKTITVLLHIWFNVPEAVEPLRDDALALLARRSGHERLPLHWGMSLATYPFLLDVATHTGRLLTLQGQVTQAQVRRRLIERWGDRELLARSVRHALRSFMLWGVLREGSGRGVYAGCQPMRVANEDDCATWLIEALMAARRSSSTGLQRVIKDPALFPLDIQVSRSDFQHHQRLELAAHGPGDEVFVRRHP